VSGSSSLTVKGSSFALHAESPRMNFGRNAEGERSWHARWKRKVARAVLPLERALAALAEAEDAPALRAYDRSLPLLDARSKAPPPAGPCRFRVELPVFGIAWVDVALEAPPGAAQRAALRKAIRGVRVGDDD
jgi:hypothetical protein